MGFLPLAVAGVSSGIGAIKGKGARKKQEKLADQQRQAALSGVQGALGMGQGFIPQAANMLQTIFNQSTGQFEPLMQDYRSMLSNALTSQGKYDQQGENLINLGNPALMGALSGLGDLQQRFRPFLEEGASAIERFLPKGATLDRLLAGQYGDINAGAGAASKRIAEFAPRGGGRITAGNDIEMARQQGLTKARAEGTTNYGQMALNNFFQGAEGTRNTLMGKGQMGLGAIGAGQQSKQLGIGEFGSKAGVALQQLQSALQALGMGGGAAGNLGQLGSSLFGQGLGAQTGLYNAQANRAYGMVPTQDDAGGLGSFFVKMFREPGVQGWFDKMIFGGKKGAGGTGTFPDWWGGD